MRDIADHAQDLIEREEAMRRMVTHTNELEPSGDCYYCGEPVKHPKKFCDRTCAEDYEFEKRMRSVGK